MKVELFSGLCTELCFVATAPNVCVTLNIDIDNETSIIL